ncbi:hypothetical protein [Streptomyces sp. NPDC052042]|uniref:hypothetical protein n=1 Tax=Streptomyces sp. NPDC052042 TaxID=3365683 RepID=UPI0037CD8122
MWEKLSRQGAGQPDAGAQQAEADERERLTRAELGADAYESERAAGRTLTVDDVIELLNRVCAALPDTSAGWRTAPEGRV